MQATREGSWMMTYTGRPFYPYDLRPDDFHIEDIAHALSMLCRYGGHCREFYSVAEHSVHVSRLVSPRNALCGLMHDATEAYLVDMPRPIKVGFPQYKEMEAKLWAHIAARFGLPERFPDEVETADGHMLFHEQAAIMHPTPSTMVWGMGRAAPKHLRPGMIKCWTPRIAEREFLGRFEELTK